MRKPTCAIGIGAGTTAKRIAPTVSPRRHAGGQSVLGLVPLAGLEPAQCCHYLILIRRVYQFRHRGWRAEYAAKPGGSTAPQLVGVPRPASALLPQRGTFTREREPGPRVRWFGLAHAPRWICSCGPWVHASRVYPTSSSSCRSRASPRSVSRLRSPGTRENAASPHLGTRPFTAFARAA